MQSNGNPYRPPVEDPFYSEVQKTMKLTFGGVLKPNSIEGENMMTPWIELYKVKPNGFHITGSLHSNSIDDPMHLSVTYRPYLAPECKFHIYGYYRSEFYISKITMLVGTRVMELASYTPKHHSEE